MHQAKIALHQSFNLHSRSARSLVSELQSQRQIMQSVSSTGFVALSLTLVSSEKKLKRGDTLNRKSLLPNIYEDCHLT